MRLNRALLPLLVEFVRRPLPPVQVSLRLLMLVVVFVGVFYWLWITSDRLRAAQAYHGMEAVRVTMHRDGSPPTPTKISAWHAAMARHYRDSAARAEAMMVAILLACVCSAVWVLFRHILQPVGRVRSKRTPSVR
jgi:hypothetical protein